MYIRTCLSEHIARDKLVHLFKLSQIIIHRRIQKISVGVVLKNRLATMYFRGRMHLLREASVPEGYNCFSRGV